MEIFWSFLLGLSRHRISLVFSKIDLYILSSYVGPVVAEAMFVNREEIPIYPVYRDPVSHFGFLLFPASLRV